MRNSELTQNFEQSHKDSSAETLYGHLCRSTNAKRKKHMNYHACIRKDPNFIRGHTQNVNAFRKASMCKKNMGKTGGNMCMQSFM